MTPDLLTLSSLESPIGALAFACDSQERVRGVSFGDGIDATMRREYPAAALQRGALPEGVGSALTAYFEGDRTALDGIAWSLDGARSAPGPSSSQGMGGNGFQARVWRALAEIPAGVTISYGEMAKRAGEPGVAAHEAARAAGVALNRNPIPLILACHRVVGADGSMTGFGGGLERKTWLLRHEGALLI